MVGIWSRKKFDCRSTAGVLGTSIRSIQARDGNCRVFTIEILTPLRVEKEKLLHRKATTIYVDVSQR